MVVVQLVVIGVAMLASLTAMVGLLGFVKGADDNGGLYAGAGQLVLGATCIVAGCILVVLLLR